MKQEKLSRFTLLLPQKFLILGLLASVLVALTFGFYFNTTQENITFTQNEIDGIKPSMTMQKILQLTQQHSGLSSVVLGGSGESIKSAREEKAKETFEAIAVMDRIVKERIRDQVITNKWTATAQRWNQLENQVSQAQIDASNSTQEHNDLIADYFVVLDQIVDFFQLSLDPEAASYYLMRSALYAIPTLCNSLGRIRAMGASLLSKKQATPVQIAILSGVIETSHINQREALNQLQKTYNLVPTVKTRLQLKFLSANKLYENAIKLAEDEIIIKQDLNSDAKAYYDIYTETINALFTINEPVMDQLNALLNNRLSKLKNEQLIVTGGMIALLTIAGIIAFFISRSITRPVGHLVGVIQKLASGDNTIRANMLSFDEIGILGRQFDLMVDQREAINTAIQEENETLNNSIIELLQAVARLAQKDLTITVPVAEDITGPLGDALNMLSSETAKVLNQVVQTAGDVAKVSRQVKAQSDTVINIAAEEKRQVAQSAVELSAASEAMLEIAKLALSCNQAATKAIQNTDKAQVTVLDTVQGITSIRNTIRETEKRIKRLGERSQEIGSVVTIINGISERTHILALNASMHAASAGEAGKGFAVVASEVQKLAENAREATSQISSLVNNIQIETADTVITMNDAISLVVRGTELAQQAGNEMRETRDTTAELVQLVQRISESSKIQAKTSQQLQERALQIQKSTDQTYDQLQAQGVRTDKLVSLSSSLVQSAGVFTLPQNKMISKNENLDYQFDKSLIRNLVSDHRILWTEFTDMVKSAENDNFYEANRLLSSFSTKLTEHFQVEMDELYVYIDFVEKMMTDEDKNSIKGLDDEMHKIGYAVNNLINTYTNQPISAANKETFIKEFTRAGGLLGDRIKREEKLLYPVYGKYGRLR
jgi:methyl-accepting chemotaxis protein